MESGATPAARCEGAMTCDTRQQAGSLPDWMPQLGRFACSCDCLDAESDDFDAASGIGVAVGLGVEAVETGDGIGGPNDAEFEALAVVAEVG